MTKEELENYEPKGQLIGFPKEIIARMVDCQEEQGNPRDVSVFEKSMYAGMDRKGFLWDKTKEGYWFWNEIIRKENLDFFFTKYPKQDICSECKECRKPEHQEYQESKTIKYVQVGDNAILSDITSTQSSVETEINTTEDNSQEFRVEDKVYDILLGKIGIVKEINLQEVKAFKIAVVFENYGTIFYTIDYTIEGKSSSIDKYPRLLHYRDDYNYSVIDFNNLPQRQETKRWRAKVVEKYYYLNIYFEVHSLLEEYSNTDTKLYKIGNYFQTKEQAQEVANKLNKYFNQLINK